VRVIEIEQKVVKRGEMAREGMGISKLEFRISNDV